MGITEFLTARCDEDEEVARAAKESRVRFGDAQGDDAFDEAANLAENEGAMSEVVDFIRRNSPQSVLADIAAKRRLVELCATWITEGDRHFGGWDAVSFSARTQAITAETVLRALIQQYAYHPDFNPAWRTT